MGKLVSNVGSFQADYSNGNPETKAGDVVYSSYLSTTGIIVISVASVVLFVVMVVTIVYCNKMTKKLADLESSTHKLLKRHEKQATTSLSEMPRRHFSPMGVENYGFYPGTRRNPLYHIDRTNSGPFGSPADEERLEYEHYLEERSRKLRLMTQQSDAPAPLSSQVQIETEGDKQFFPRAQTQQGAPDYGSEWYMGRPLPGYDSTKNNLNKQEESESDNDAESEEKKKRRRKAGWKILKIGGKIAKHVVENQLDE